MKSIQKYMMIVFLGIGTTLAAVEERPLQDVPMAEMISQTQRAFPKEDVMSLMWFMTADTMAVTMMGGRQWNEDEHKGIREMMEGKLVVLIAHGKIGMFGGVTYAVQNDLVDKIKIEVRKGEKNHKLKLSSSVSQDLQLVLNAMKGNIAMSLGQMGTNAHFLVYTNTDDNGQTIYNERENDTVKVIAEAMTGVDRQSLEFPSIVDALFIPRKCSNGTNAHVTWVYDPWTGEKLPE